jgi:hypothetical protein
MTFKSNKNIESKSNRKNNQLHRPKQNINLNDDIGAKPKPSHSEPHDTKKNKLFSELADSIAQKTTQMVNLQRQLQTLFQQN